MSTLKKKVNLTRLGLVRESRKVSQSVLASALGIHRSTLSNWENGHVDPRLSLSQVKIIAQHLDLSVQEVLQLIE